MRAAGTGVGVGGGVGVGVWVGVGVRVALGMGVGVGPKRGRLVVIEQARVNTPSDTADSNLLIFMLVTIIEARVDVNVFGACVFLRKPEFLDKFDRKGLVSIYKAILLCFDKAAFAC
jgi:hypothetical protein